MSHHEELLEHARRLRDLAPTDRNDADLRRAVSAAYYALFHLLVDEAAEMFLADAHLPGPGPDRERLKGLLRRSFSHTEANDVMKSLKPGQTPKQFTTTVCSGQIPPELQVVAESFVALHEKRERADYQIDQSIEHAEVVDAIELAEKAFRNWKLILSMPIARVVLAALAFERKRRREP